MNIEYRMHFLVESATNGWLASDYDECTWTSDVEHAHPFTREDEAERHCVDECSVVVVMCGYLMPPDAAAPVRVTKFFEEGAQPFLVDWLTTEKQEALRQGFEIARENVDVRHDGGTSWTTAQRELGEVFLHMGKVPT